MAFTEDRVAMPPATLLLGCLEIEVQKLESPPKYVGLRTGTQVEFGLALRGKDECCQGLAWVRIDSIYPSSAAFPNPDLTPLKCGLLQWAVVLEIGVVRCAPTPDAGQMVTVDQWNTLTERVMADFAAMNRAVCCFLDEWPKMSVVGRWSPLALATNCAGGTMTITVAASACNCVEDESPS